MAKKKLSFLYCGTEVITDEFRIAHVDAHHTNARVTIRYHNPLWPFPEWEDKRRDQLVPVEQEYEEALF